MFQPVKFSDGQFSGCGQAVDLAVRASDAVAERLLQFVCEYPYPSDDTEIKI